MLNSDLRHALILQNQRQMSEYMWCFLSVLPSTKCTFWACSLRSFHINGQRSQFYVSFTPKWSCRERSWGRDLRASALVYYCFSYSTNLGSQTFIFRCSCKRTESINPIKHCSLSASCILHLHPGAEFSSKEKLTLHFRDLNAKYILHRPGWNRILTRNSCRDVQSNRLKTAADDNYS